MPELPEVETICRGLRAHAKGRRIDAVRLYERRLRLEVDPDLPARLQGRTIVEVSRRSKYILLGLDRDGVWLFHLGMSGKLILADPWMPGQKHDHIVATLDNGRELRYHDPRRFGLSLFTERAALENLPQLRHLGPDPFAAAFDGAYLYALTRKSDRRVRDFLLDQRVVAGIGNIYANEILNRVGVRPAMRCRRLSKAQAAQIAATAREVLADAIRWCGTSFSDYRDADDKFGEFQNHLRVYDRAGEPCRSCASAVKRVWIGNRSAFYCPACQR